MYASGTDLSVWFTCLESRHPIYYWVVTGQLSKSVVLVCVMDITEAGMSS